MIFETEVNKDGTKDLVFKTTSGDRELLRFANEDLKFADEGLTINNVVKEAHENAREKGFWEDYDLINRLEAIGEPMESIKKNAINSRLMLITSEVAEATEELRTGNKKSFELEMADIFIRVADLCGGLEIDLAAAVAKKMGINKNRERLHGKEF